MCMLPIRIPTLISTCATQNNLLINNHSSSAFFYSNFKDKRGTCKIFDENLLSGKFGFHSNSILQKKNIPKENVDPLKNQQNALVITAHYCLHIDSGDEKDTNSILKQ